MLKYYRVFFLILSSKCTNCLQKYFDKKLKSSGFCLACPYIIWHNCLLWRFGKIVLSRCLSLSLYLSLSLRNQISSDTTVGSGALAVIVISFVFAFVFVFIFVCVFVFVLTALWQNYCSMTWGCLGRGGDSLSLWHEEGGGVMFEDNYLNLFPFSPDTSSSHFINTSRALFKCEPAAYTSNCETCSLTTF